MAEFEDRTNLNGETSELEMNGKFKLAHDELDEVSGSGTIPASAYGLPTEALCARTLVKEYIQHALQQFGAPAEMGLDEDDAKGPLDLEGHSLYRDNFDVSKQLKWASFDL